MSQRPKKHTTWKNGLVTNHEQKNHLVIPWSKQQNARPKSDNFKSSMLAPWLLLHISTNHNHNKQNNDIETLQVSYLLPFLLMLARKVELELNWYWCKNLLKTTSCVENKVGDELQQFLKHFHSHQGHNPHAYGCILRWSKGWIITSFEALSLISPNSHVCVCNVG